MGFDASGKLGYFDSIHAEYTVIKEGSHIFDSLNTEYASEFSKFYERITSDIRDYLERGVLTNSRENSILISCVPWFSYTHLSFQKIQPVFY